MRIPFVGDLSRADAELLAELGRQSKRIVEFGAGGSTQIFAQVAPPGATILSVETDSEWIKRTRSNLRRLGVERVRFMSFVGWQIACAEKFPPSFADSEFDLIFNDGARDLRRLFATEAWVKLAIGGRMLFHDTRRPNDILNVIALVNEHFLEISEISLNLHGSNITQVIKKAPEPYQNWNSEEGRVPWEYGLEEPPEDWPGEKMEGREAPGTWGLEEENSESASETADRPPTPDGGAAPLTDQ